MEKSLRLNKLAIQDYINMRLSSGNIATNVTYHKVRCLNIKDAGNFQQELSRINDSFDFNFEPSKETLLKFREIFLTKN